MFDFKCNKGRVMRAVFAGSMDDIMAEVAMGISVLYGSLAKQDKEEAEKFKRTFAMTIFHDGCLADDPVIFSTELVENLLEDDDYESTVKTVKKKVESEDKKPSGIDKALKFLDMLSEAAQKFNEESENKEDD